MICLCCGQPLITQTIPAYKTIPAQTMVDCRNRNCSAFMITTSEKSYLATLTNYLKDHPHDCQNVSIHP